MSGWFPMYKVRSITEQPVGAVLDEVLQLPGSPGPRGEQVVYPETGAHELHCRRHRAKPKSITLAGTFAKGNRRKIWTAVRRSQYLGRYFFANVLRG